MGEGETATHAAGNVVGLTASDYLSLPAGARLSIRYQAHGPEEHAEGFLMLKKL